MNKIRYGLMAAALLSGGIAFAQGELDAYRYSQRDMNGSLRRLRRGQEKM